MLLMAIQGGSCFPRQTNCISISILFRSSKDAPGTSGRASATGPGHRSTQRPWSRSSAGVVECCVRVTDVPKWHNHCYLTTSIQESKNQPQSHWLTMIRRARLLIQLRHGFWISFQVYFSWLFICKTGPSNILFLSAYVLEFVPALCWM